MLDRLLQEKMYEAARRENLDMNDTEVQEKMLLRKNQIEGLLYEMIVKQTKHCGCGKRTPNENHN